MISDSITGTSATSVPNSRDFSKKKRANRSAKLKQCKLDARREQWLSQASVAGKNKGCKEVNDDRKFTRGNANARGHPFENLDIGRRDDDNRGTIHHEIDADSLENSPLSTILGGTDSSPNFSGSSSSSRCCRGCCSGNITEEEDGDEDDGCLEDWEAFADALAAVDTLNNQSPPPECHLRQEPVLEAAALMDSTYGLGSTNGSGLGVKNASQDCPTLDLKIQGNSRAWRLDDEFRPCSLPNLLKNHSFPATDRNFGSMAVPFSCPICYEDLDLTDSRFLPCACGFRLCLFCYKRICDGDGRCPGCRKPYDQNAIKSEASVLGSSLTFGLTRTCSMAYES